MSSSPPAPTIIDVDAADFQAQVLDRSQDVPVVVDFWAAWCGPCRTLGPMLESAVARREGEVILAKIDVDANPQIAQAFRVQGIPAVKAFKDGRVVDEFTGVVPADTIEQMLDRIVPTEADRLVAVARTQQDEDSAASRAAAEQALQLDPGHPGAAILLAGLIVDEDPERALELVRPHRPDPEAEAVVVRAELATSGGDEAALTAAVAADPQDGASRLQLGRLRAAAGEYEEAMSLLLDAVRLGGESREPAREQLVALFGVLGDDHELVRDTRPKLARALF